GLLVEGVDGAHDLATDKGFEGRDALATEAAGAAINRELGWRRNAPLGRPSRLRRSARHTAERTDCQRQASGHHALCIYCGGYDHRHVNSNLSRLRIWV